MSRPQVETRAAGRVAFLRRRWATILAWSLVLLYIATFTWLAILRHASFNSSGFDLGIYDQVIWNTRHGRFFFYTTTGQPLLHLSNHASFNILLLAPFYLIYSGPEMLLLLQAAAVGLGGLPLFWLAREKLDSDLAGLSLLLAYLFFPTLQIVNLWDFHPPVISVLFFMLAFYFIEKDRPGWFLLCAILAMSGKEQLPLQVAFLGLYVLLWHRRWQLGLLTIGLSLTWFFLVMNWIIPANSVVGEHIFLGYYDAFGDSPARIVLTVLTRPDLVLQNLLQPAKLKYLFDVLAPFAFLPLLGLPILLIGAPSFAINLLSANQAMYDATGAQYGADVAPWLAWAALYGMLALRTGLLRLRPRAQPYLTAGLSLLLILAATVWQLWRGFSPLALDPPYTTWTIGPHERLAQRFIDQIPPDAPLAAQGKLYPHLSQRLIAYQLPDVNEAEYVFADVTRGTWPVHPNDLKAQLEGLLAGEFGVLDAADGYLLLQRGLSQKTIPDSFYDFARVESAEPQYPLQVDFGDAMRLLGYDVLDDPRRQETAVRFYWQALQPLDGAYRLYPFFLDDAGRVVETTDLRPMLTQLWYPPQRWQPGQIVVSETLPWTLGQRWSLAMGVLAGPDWADWAQRLPVRVVEADEPLRRFEANTWVRLGTFERRGRTLARIAPDEGDLLPPLPRQANLADLIDLRGYELAPQPARPGGELTVTLYWHAQAAIPRDYTVFVHLLGPDGQRVAQHDGSPWWEVPLPTSTWQPGETLRDRHTLSLPADLPPGQYTLITGLYDWQTLERLSVLENGQPVNNFVTLGEVTVQ